MTFGWNATCYQILNPGIHHWFSSVTQAVVGYTRRYRMLLVAGSPVCDAQDLARVCQEFEQFARDRECGVCYVCAEERLRALLENSSTHATVTLGAQPVWVPAQWPQLILNQRSLRAQLNRCRNKSVSVERLTPAEASQNPELQNILDQWLSSRCLPPMHFLVEPQILGEKRDDRIVFVAKRAGVSHCLPGCMPHDRPAWISCRAVGQNSRCPKRNQRNAY